MNIFRNSYKPPFNEKLIDQSGVLSRVWFQFFQLIVNVINFFGQEQSFELVNNQSSPANIEGMLFDSRYTSLVIVKYFVQRTTNSNELVQSGIFNAVYRPNSNDWRIDGIGFGGSGITFSILSSGQVQYTTTNQAGTKILSRIVWRTESIAGKAYYSQAG